MGLLLFIGAYSKCSRPDKINVYLYQENPDKHHGEEQKCVARMWQKSHFQELLVLHVLINNVKQLQILRIGIFVKFNVTRDTRDSECDNVTYVWPMSGIVRNSKWRLIKQN